MAFLIYIVSSLSFASVELPFTVTTYADAYTLRTMVYLGGFGLLYSQHALQCESSSPGARHPAIHAEPSI